MKKQSPTRNSVIGSLVFASVLFRLGIPGRLIATVVIAIVFALKV